MWIKAGLMLIAAVAVGTIIYLGYSHYTGLVKDLETARINEAQLTTAVEQQKQTIDVMATAITEWEQHSKTIEATMGALAQSQAEATVYQRSLANVFAKHDLKKLSSAKPVLIERAINRGTANVFGMFREATTPSRDGTSRGEAPAAGSEPAPATPASGAPEDPVEGVDAGDSAP